MNKTQATCTWEVLTPEAAEAAFNGRAPNRRFNPENAHPYLRDMVAGRWGMSLIVFDMGGQLIDGQHRVWACWKSGRPVWFWIGRNWPRAEQSNMDMHRKRKVHEQINLSRALPFEMDRRLEAILKMMDRGAVRPHGGYATWNEVLQYGRAHASCVEFLMAACPTYVAGVTTAPVLAAIGRAYYCRAESRERIMDFCRILSGGVAGSGSDDGAATMLRERLLVMAASGRTSGQTAATETFRLTEKALSLFLDHVTPRQLKFSGSDMFPPPDPRMKVEVEPESEPVGG